MKEFLNWLFKCKLMYLEDSVRINYGYHFSDAGISYMLERKIKKRWIKDAWTYAYSHESFDKMKEYLFWYEIDNKKSKRHSPFYGEKL